METVLEMKNITKRFGDMVANDAVCFDVRKGEVHTLLGENGAGKSTLMNILFGLYKATSGSIFLRGKELSVSCPADAVRAKIGMVHQHFMLVEAMSVFNNIILGEKEEYGVFVNRAKLRSAILELSEKYGLDIELDKKISEISIGAQQRVEILKSLYRGAEILVLDEPTAVLTDQETERLFQIVHRLTGEGKSVIFISHKMREVMKISDRITILRAGKAVATYAIADADPQMLANEMTGKVLSETIYEKTESKGPNALELQSICYHQDSKHGSLREVSLTVKAGEILGIAGVDGNGQSQLAQLITGNLAPDGGELLLHEKAVSKFIPKRFIQQGVSHIPEDRNKMGLIGGTSVVENLLIKDIETPELSRFGGWFLLKKKMAAQADALQEKYDIRCVSVNQLAKDLSGGNQQKVILARELEKHPKLLVAVHPTRGLDIGAAQFIHDAMVQAKNDQCAILLISADLDEILALSDRIAVMFEGRIMNIHSGNNPPLEQISLEMAGK